MSPDTPRIYTRQGNSATNYCYGGRLRLKCDGTRAETRFRLSAKRASPFKSARGVSSVDYWQARCTYQPAGFVLLVQACVLQSCDVYWLPTPFASFPFTSPPMRRRVPSHFRSSLKYILQMYTGKYTLNHVKSYPKIKHILRITKYAGVILHCPQSS
jgi:hypothetical protein